MHLSGKNSPKKQEFYQELIAVSGTFASPEKQGLIIDNSRLWNLNFFPRMSDIKQMKIVLNEGTRKEGVLPESLRNRGGQLPEADNKS